MSTPLPRFLPLQLEHNLTSFPAQTSPWPHHAFSFLEDSPFLLYSQPDPAVLNTAAKAHQGGKHSSQKTWPLAPLHPAFRLLADSQAFSQAGAPPSLISLSSPPAPGSCPLTALSANSSFLSQLSNRRAKGPQQSVPYLRAACFLVLEALTLSFLWSHQKRSPVQTCSSPSLLLPGGTNRALWSVSAVFTLLSQG